jgi:fumarate hydratase class II
MEERRVERDSMGEVNVPAGALWGPQTQRAVENFEISGRTLDARLIRALALIKAEAAAVNGAKRSVPSVSARVARAIVEAAEEVAAGRWGDEFPVDVYQTGSGTSSNMNMNEVLANLAGERLGEEVHPNDQVNASQSSNDVFPSAILVAATEAVVRDLRPAVDHLAATLRRQARTYSDSVKAGRTHLMDATPVTFGQELGGYAAQIEAAAERFGDLLGRLGQLPLGGTAVGTGLNAPPGFGREVAERLAARLDLPLQEATDHFAAQGARDEVVECSAACRGLAVALTKIANDLRWMGSGPNAGLGEIRIPSLQPGSSIMPGKVNPVIAEVVTQVAARVIGNDATVAFAASQGSFELNTYLPVIAETLLESITLLAAACRHLADKCVAGIAADGDRMRRYAESSPAIATALNPYLGYDVIAEVVKEAEATGWPIRDVVIARGLLSPDVVADALDVLAMTKGGIHGTGRGSRDRPRER